ncbi:MAG: rhomboid family intramembrane serine protease [Chloroflexota bacterium]|nr:rhomboid family intramembrane serine protease [Chloroflexota bacterium]
MFPISDGDLKTRTFPVVNISLIVLCIAVFVYELVVGNQDAFFFKFGLIPNELVHGIDYELLLTPAGTIDISSPVPTWATVFTSMFLHGGWMHFLGNMLFLWVFGDNVEDRFGHFRYLLFYLAAGVAASSLQVLTNTSSDIPTIGASGAIAGVLGAYLLLFPRSRVNTAVFFFLITIIRIPAVYLLGFWFVLQFFGGIGSIGLSAQSGGIAYWAHVGGFLFGLAVVIIYKLFTPRNPPPNVPRDVKYWRGRPIDY